MEQTMPMPLDVKLMNVLASALFLGCAALVLAAGVRWVANLPALGISRIIVQGELEHNNAVSLQANVMPVLKGNFFTMDLAATKHAFEQAPWVREARIKREFPHTLSVVLQEQDATAIWGDASDARLLNSDGQIFEGDSTDPDLQQLPRLQGPEGRSAEVLSMYQALAPVFATLNNPLVKLGESDSGSWRATLQSGATVELGQGAQSDIRTRVAKFVESLPQVTSNYRRTVAALESADLRHASGYAVRLQGVTTGTAPPAKPASKK